MKGGMAIGAASILPGMLGSCSMLSKPSATPSLFITSATQAQLEYPFNALEPVIDAQTMELHHTKHAAGYAKNLRDAMAAESVPTGTSVENLMGGISRYSVKMRCTWSCWASPQIRPLSPSLPLPSLPTRRKPQSPSVRRVRAGGSSLLCWLWVLP